MRAVFPDAAALAAVLSGAKPVVLERRANSSAGIARVFDAFDGARILLVPLVRRERVFGGMLMVGRDLSRPDWLSFAQGNAAVAGMSPGFGGDSGLLTTNIFGADGVTELTHAQLPIVRALNGEKVAEELICVRRQQAERGNDLSRHEENTIVLSTARVGDLVEISVKDSGAGMRR